MPDYQTIDAHVHVAGPGDQQQGLYWHKRFGESVNFKKLKFIRGVYLNKITDRLMVNSLLMQTRSTHGVNKMVILALDHVYDVEGRCLGPARDATEEIGTTLYVSNRFVMDLCRQPGNANLLPGISVHPFRDDAEAELDKHHGDAVLCKWLPSSQMIDLNRGNAAAREKLNRFFEKLSQIKLPLLFHAGREDSIPAANGDAFQKHNNPEFITEALDAGVTVIVAHCGCSYFDEEPRTDVVDSVLDLIHKKETDCPHWQLFADISAVFSPYRKREVLDQVFRSIRPEHLVYGSDWPNPSKGARWWANPLWILRYSGENLIDRYKKICDKWLPDYYSEAEIDGIYTRFHRILENLDRGYLVSSLP